ncbi:hypothetical protein IWW50_000817 [Coemansia erecta]|nr:hypothetical protein GGF43_002057 [Coemansia sp. RSA 2618]KAJ2829495.1 hypothetical protein IWW50_000817 [Coemansia erecta]
MATPEAPLREILKSISFTQLPLRHIEPFFEAEKIYAPRLFIYGWPPSKAQKSSLPTYDIECLRTLAVLKFANYGFDIHYTNEPNGSPNGKLPYLLLPNGQAISSEGVLEHLKQSGHNLPESTLTNELVYCTMVERNLVPAAEYTVWVDSAGFEKIGDGRYLREYPAVVRYLLGWFKASNVAHDMRVRMPEYGAALDGEILFENAIRVLDSLVVLLGDREYLAGSPGLLDAWVFACLNIIIEAPVKSPIRTALLRPDSKYQPLVSYALRLAEKHMDTGSSE